MSSTGESRRRAEIEAKRAKLAELKRAREERTSRLAAGRLGSDGRTASESTTPASRRDLDDLVATLVGSSGPRGSSASSLGGGRASLAPGEPGAPSESPRKSGAPHADSSDFGGDSEARSVTMRVDRGDGEVQGVPTNRAVPDMVDVDVELFEFPQQERVYYTKEVQTSGASDDEHTSSGGVGTTNEHGISSAAEEAIRARILREQAMEREQEEVERMKSEEDRLQREIEEGMRELSADELGTIYGAQDFTDFVEQSSKIVERALTDAYDYMKDYTLVEDAVADDAGGRQVKNVRTFWDEKLCRGRSITSLDWSTKHSELCVASYSRTEMGSTDDPDGLVLVWNMHLADRPEFIFHAQTDVLSVVFSPFHPNLVIGGTYSGQILIWDTRARALPVLKTPLSAAGHTHPVYAMQMVGTQNAHNLISASTDGTVCSWMLDLLARPQETLELLNPHHPKTDEVSITTLGFPDQETTSFCVGTEEGAIYPASRFDRAGAKAGLNALESYRAHAAPVTSLHFHPLAGPVDFSDLFLSASMDWTTRLWRIRPSSSATAAVASAVASGARAPVGHAVPPLRTFEEATDYVYDVRWHPLHPALFAQVDGAGRFDLYNLNVDNERPIISTAVGSGRALNKLAWDRKDGKRAAMGGADGRVYVYDLGALAVPRDDEWMSMQRTVSELLSPGGTTGLSSARAASAAGAAEPMSVRVGEMERNAAPRVSVR